jgi:hypothetical protein
VWRTFQLEGFAEVNGASSSGSGGGWEGAANTNLSQLEKGDGGDEDGDGDGEGHVTHKTTETTDLVSLFSGSTDAVRYAKVSASEFQDVNTSSSKVDGNGAQGSQGAQGLLWTELFSEAAEVFSFMCRTPLLLLLQPYQICFGFATLTASLTSM